MRPYWRKLTFKCDSAAGQEAKVIQAVWIVILLAEKIFFWGCVCNTSILSIRMFFKSSAFHTEEFTSVHISVSGNILQMHTHSKCFQKPLQMSFLYLPLIHSLQVRCVTVLRASVIGSHQFLTQTHQPLICFTRVFILSVSGRVTHNSAACLDFPHLSSLFKG